MTSLKAPSRVPLYLSLLVAFHIAIVIASNYLVQLPINLLGFHSTWGAFSFPFIFLATDLTVRLIGKQPARRVITRAMLPALVASYVGYHAEPTIEGTSVATTRAVVNASLLVLMFNFVLSAFLFR